MDFIFQKICRQIYKQNMGYIVHDRALFFVPLFSMIIVIIDRCKGIFRRYHLRVFYSERFLKLLFVQKDKDGKKRECPIF